MAEAKIGAQQRHDPPRCDVRGGYVRVWYGPDDDDFLDVTPVANGLKLGTHDGTSLVVVPHVSNRVSVEKRDPK